MVVRIVRLFLSYLLYEFSTRKKEVVIFSGYNGLKIISIQNICLNIFLRSLIINRIL